MTVVLRREWWKTDQECPECGAAALRTRSGNQLVCSSGQCDWYVRVDAIDPKTATTCKHEKLRAANGGRCPVGCP